MKKKNTGYQNLYNLVQDLKYLKAYLDFKIPGKPSILEVDNVYEDYIIYNEEDDPISYVLDYMEIEDIYLRQRVLMKPYEIIVFLKRDIKN